MNLETLSIEQLAELRDKVILTLNDRVSAKQRELQQEMERFGSLASLQKPKALKSSPAKPKYQKGDLSWSGRGTQPSWIKQHLALGGTLEELRNAAAF
jgi:DNA-binding protein H-NS